MPYKLVGNCVHKKNADGSAGDTVPGGCHDTPEEAKNHMRALYANVKESGVVEMSLRITKASYNKSEDTPRNWTAIDSDIDEDLYQEKMSIDLYKDFINRIETHTPVPEQFKSIICENDWCGGMPYLSLAHYKAGDGLKNVPGLVKSVFVDGTRLKSKGILGDTPLGRKTFEALVEDLYKKKSGDTEHLPVRISIGFLDLEHKHLSEVGGQEFTFERKDVGQICPLCAQGIGGKIYTKGQLVHLAMTRVPVNPRTEMVAEKSMDIQTKKDDAKSIVGDLADELEEKSAVSDVLVVRSDEMGTTPTPDPSELTKCYDPNTGGWDNACIASVMDKYMPQIRDSIGVPVKSTTMPKGLLDAVVATLYKSNGYDVPVVEDGMDKVVKNTMDKVEKAILGGESVPEKPFKYTQDGVTITGDGNNTIPAPVKAKPAMDAEDAKDNGDDEAAEGEAPTKKKSTALDNEFATLKNLVASKASVDEINKAFSNLGTAVESEYAEQTAKPVDMTNLAEIVKSAVEAAVTPLRMEIATLKTQTSNTVSNSSVVKSKALTLNGLIRPEDMIQKAIQNQPTRKLSQIEQIARKSTGVL